MNRQQQFELAAMGLDDRVLAWGPTVLQPNMPINEPSSLPSIGEETDRLAIRESKARSLSNYERINNIRQVLNPREKVKLAFNRKKKAFQALKNYLVHLKVIEKKVALRRKANIFDRRWVDVYRQREWLRDTSIEVSRLFVKRYIRKWRKELKKAQSCRKLASSVEKYQRLLSMRDLFLAMRRNVSRAKAVQFQFQEEAG